MSRCHRRVEDGVLQQFRLKHQSRRDRRTIKAAMWALAAAAVIVFTLGVWNLHQWRLRSLANVAPQNSLHGTDAGYFRVKFRELRSTAPSETTFGQQFSVATITAISRRLPGATFYGAEEDAVVRAGNAESFAGRLGSAGK